MVAIVLGILKIIGILLLIILGLILFVLFSVLLVPVRYRAEGSIYEHLKGSASASWFLRLISIKVSYDGEAQMDFRILWFHPGRGKDGEAENALEQELAERVETAEVKPEQVKTERTERAETCETEVYSETAKSEVAVQKTKIGETPKIPETETPDNVDLKSKKSSFLLSAIPERIRKCIANLKARIHRISQRFKKIARKFRQGKKQWETILTFIRDEENKKAFRLAKRQLFALIRHVLPQKLEGKIHFGFGDPYTTGQVLTWISPFYGLYGRHVQLCPDFMEPCLDGELKLKGRIRLGTLIFLAFRMFQNKQIRLWVKKWRES